MLVIQSNYDLHYCLMNNKQLYQTLFYFYSKSSFKNIRPTDFETLLHTVATFVSIFILSSISQTSMF